jgi:hypothetical protein
MWVQLKDYPNYLVNDIGEIVSLYRGKWRVLKTQLDVHGYPIIRLSDKGKKFKSVRIHKLVLLAFCGLPTERCVVNHINGLKSDNRLENLEYCTYSENNKHAYDNGLKEPRLKIDKLDLDKIQKLTQYLSQAQIARAFRVNPTTISNLLNGKTKSYVEEQINV